MTACSCPACTPGPDVSLAVPDLSELLPPRIARRPPPALVQFTLGLAVRLKLAHAPRA